MKILAFDLGDKWTGVAISDPLQILARPLTTVATEQLGEYIEKTIEDEKIQTIVLGYPKTLKGKESEQTLKVKAFGEQLKQQFPTINWIWWDERFTSKQADRIVRPKTKEAKLSTHAVAAALLLMGYLESLQFQSPPENAPH